MQFPVETRFESALASTNTAARALAEQGCVHGTLVVADRQTGGRGRKGRAWFSPPGCGIYASLVLRPELPPDHIPVFTLAAGVAVAETLRAATGLSVDIKWPNDVLYGGRKLCGILTEMSSDADRVDFVIVGIGINVNTPRSRFRDELRDIATSTFAETGHTIQRAVVLSAIMARFEEIYREVDTSGTEGVLRRWSDLCPLFGRQVQVERVRDVVKGTVVGITTAGALQVRDAAGVVETVLSGDVSSL